MEKLKPCPFCSGDGKFWERGVSRWSNEEYSVYIECENCEASQMSWHTKEEAIEAWNKRSTTNEHTDLHLSLMGNTMVEMRQLLDEARRIIDITVDYGDEWQTDMIDWLKRYEQYINQGNGDKYINHKKIFDKQ